MKKIRAGPKAKTGGDQSLGSSEQSVENDTSQDQENSPDSSGLVMARFIRNEPLNPGQRRDSVTTFGQKFGNQHLQRMLLSLNQARVQRKVSTSPEENQTGLTSPRFAGDPILEACFNDKGRLKKGDKGPAVTKIQEALIDFGIPLPKFGADGDFGPETGKAVTQFKIENNLTPRRGDVGPKTMARLDQLFQDSSGSPLGGASVAPSPSGAPPKGKPASPGPNPAPSGLLPAASGFTILDNDPSLGPILQALQTKPKPNFTKAYLILNGLSIEDMLNKLEELKIQGFLQDLLNNLDQEGKGVFKDRLHIAMFAVKMVGIFTSSSFLSDFKATLNKIEPEGKYAILHLITQNEPVIVRLKLTAGFQALKAEEQQKLLTYLGGINQEVSDPARDRMDTLLQDPKQDKNKASTFRKFLDGPVDHSPLGVRKGTFDAGRVFHSQTGPVEVPNYKFESHREDALKFEVKISDKVTPVFLPKHPDPKFGVNHSIGEVGDGLAATPKAVRKLVVKVNVEPRRNTQDPFFEKKYQQKGFRSYMTAGAAGVVSIYPQVAAQEQTELDGALIHETGHILSNQKFGDKTSDPRWNPWKTAMQKDTLVASGYARSDPQEDFAEALKLYEVMKLRPEFGQAEYRALMPERFKIIDDLLK